MIKYEKDYRALLERILSEGHDIYNERTGKTCRAVYLADFVYNVGAGEVPLLTTKQCFPVSSVAEILGYLRRYTNAQQFADIGSPTWFANANDNEAWLHNPMRKGYNDLGQVYGAVTEEWELQHIYDQLKQGKDDRGLIFNMYRPETFYKGCLRPCLYEHIWTLMDGTLHLTATQRSGDVPLGVPFNSFSLVFLLKLMAQITGNKAGVVSHRIINVHIYEDQLEGVETLLSRKPYEDLQDTDITLEIKPFITTLEQVVKTDTHARDFFTLEGYRHQGKITFPFSK